MASNVLQIFRITLTRGSALQLASNATKSTITIPKTVLNRTFASNAPNQGGSKKGLITAIALLAGGGGGYYFWTTGQLQQFLPESCRTVDYQKVYNAIAATLEEEGYDDGSYGPVYVRLAWHCSGTYDKNAGDGGSSKATMRFDPEASHDGNAGLHIARDRLEKIKKQFPTLSYGDLWTLAGTCALQEMGGPIIPWRPGRVDGTAADCTPDGRLPDGGNPDPKHPRDVFYRMGFNDQEITALIGAHAIGRCHADRSGFDGPWTDSPTGFSNFFFIELLNRKWVDKSWNGPKQFVDKETGKLMMLPADMAFKNDKEFKKYVDLYAKDEKKFFEDFTAAWIKLTELGVKFKEGTPTYTFTPTS